MSAVVNEELRTAVRIGVRTPVIVYSYDVNSKFIRTRAWTDDLSVTGAKITSERQLVGGEIWLRIMLPDLKHQVLSAEVVREIAERSKQLVDIRRSFYGLRFTGLADEATLRLIDSLDEQSAGQKLAQG